VTSPEFNSTTASLTASAEHQFVTRQLTLQSTPILHPPAPEQLTPERLGLPPSFSMAEGVDGYYAE